jgi:drug/metabolite transporter (DMT)-like permease
MASMFALLAAAIYGAADFLGGIATRRATMIGTVLTTQGAGLLFPLAVTPLLPDAHVTRHDLLFGALAGVTGSTGVGLLYLALAIGPMSVVAPITAVCAALVPLGIGLVLGERPQPLAGAGVVVALIAVALLSQSDTQSDPDGHAPVRLGRGVRVALASGVAIGGFFACLAQTKAAAVLWPLAMSRSVSVSIFLAIALATGRPAGVPRGALAPALACGALDMVANALYLAAARQGQLGLVATLSSLYPASTVLLARLVLGERLGVWQQAGVAGAVGAVLLIVGNS